MMKSAFIILAVVIGFTISCTSAKDASTGTTETRNTSPDKIENLNASVDLADHLRKVPGLSVTGQGSNARVTIRGSASFTSDVEPLFVIDGTPIQGGLSTVSSMINVANIKSVRVLKTPSETSAYGMRGSNGVIEITMK